MGCAASSSTDREVSLAAKKYATHTSSDIGTASPCAADVVRGRRRTRTGGGCDSNNNDDSLGEGEQFKDENTKPLMSLDERLKVVQLYSSMFQSPRQVLATIGRIKTTMKRWVQAARQRLRDKKRAAQLNAAAGGAEGGHDHEGNGSHQILPPQLDGTSDILPSRGMPASPKDGTGVSQPGRVLTTGDGADPLTDADGWTVGTPATARLLGGDEEEDEAVDLPLFPVFLQDSDGNGLLSPTTTRGAEEITPVVTPSFDPLRRQSRHDNEQPQSCSETNTDLPQHFGSPYDGRGGETRKAQLALAGETLIAQRLKHLGLEQMLMDDIDGNCQFRALAHQIFGDASRHAEVRKKICTAMVAKLEDEYTFLFESPQDCQDYFDLMAEDGTLGDELTLRSACDVYGIVVHLITSEAEQYYVRYVPNMAAIDPDDAFDMLDVFLTVIQPVHFNSVTLPHST
jgi:hypothetical protein